ncbi:MAG TPA: TolC family protein [Candidatus Acidoferrales bacterium]|nr:TolC family protein [Candidatus Acidoferrales bacterium]
MKRILWVWCACAAFSFLADAVQAQTVIFPEPQWFREVVKRPASPATLPSPQHLRDYVVDSKLRLTLEQAVQVALANNTDLHVDEISYQNARYAILRAYSPFDPLFSSSASASRSTAPQASQLGGAQTLSSLNQNVDATYNEFFPTGTNLSIDLNTSRFTSNSIFNTFNPSVSSGLTFTVTQSLLKNRGLFVNRAPILIARLGYKQSRAVLQQQINDVILSVVAQYWTVVQARETLGVLQKSLEQAQATYEFNKKQLELGALSPLDIYKPEADVAARRVQVIQSEYQLKQQEDSLRRLVGADLDPTVSVMDLDLIEPAEPTGDLFTIDAGQAMEKAIANRPEFEAARNQLAADDINLRLFHNEAQPTLNLQGFYASNGLGGNQLDPSVSPPVIISTGGLANAFGQIGAFDFPSYGLTLRLTLPIRNRQAEADIATGQNRKLTDLYGERTTEQAVRLETKNAVNQLELSKLTLAAAKVQRDLTQKDLAAEQRKYELGTETIFFVLDAQTQLASAEANVVQAEISYHIALAQVDHAVGAALDKHHVVVSDSRH